MRIDQTGQSDVCHVAYLAFGMVMIGVSPPEVNEFEANVSLCETLVLTDGILWHKYGLLVVAVISGVACEFRLSFDRLTQRRSYP